MKEKGQTTAAEENIISLGGTPGIEAVLREIIAKMSPQEREDLIQSYNEAIAFEARWFNQNAESAWSSLVN